MVSTAIFLIVCILPYLSNESCPKTMANPSIKITKNHYEYQLWELKKLVVGIDEVGRGCLAGPVVTGAVILPHKKTHPLLKDSKILTPQERLTAYNWITKHCYYQIGIIHHRLIDIYNIYQATMLGMKKALINVAMQCPHEIGAVIIDAMPLKINDLGLNAIPVYHFPKGESKSSSIAAASIVAKVTRDRLMDLYEPIFPGYELTQHKGYATELHRRMITKNQHSLIHRTTFLGAFLDAKHNDKQQTIF